MFRFSNRLFSILAIFTLVTAPVNDLFARGKRGGGFGRSSSHVSRPAFPSSSYSSPWGSSRSSREVSPGSRSDSTLTSRVNRGGSFQSRGEAIDSRQSPSTHAPDFNRSPGRSTSSTTSPQRNFSPSRVPESVRLPDGRSAPVYMDRARGGYGFWDSVGNWVLLSAIMNSANRGAYQPQYAPTPEGGSPMAGPGSQFGYGAPVPQPSSGAGALLSVIGLMVLAILVTAGVVMHRSGSPRRTQQPLDARFTPPNRRRDPFGSVPPPMPDASPLSEWMNLPLGSFVTLSDTQALEDARARGLGLRGIDYRVESVAVVKDFDGFATWVLLHLDDGHQKLVLMVKGDESHIDHRVYHATEDFRPAKREALLNRGDTWLFEAPGNAHNVNPANLRYAAEIHYSIEGQELIYVRKEHGERHGEYTERPELGGLGSLIATVAEYVTSDPTDNPELLVLEIATTKNKTGEVSIYFGCPIRASEASIVKAA